MGGLLFLFYPWGIILQAIAIVHFIRRRPDTYWLWIIILFGGIGALIYIFAEVVPDVGILREAFHGVSRRKRMQELWALIQDNPSAGNYEELGDLYLEEKQFAPARQCFDKAISPRTTHADPFYHRGICALEMGDYAAARADLERVLQMDPKYDYHRAAGLAALAVARSGDTERADKMFREALQLSTLSETQYNYAALLDYQGRTEEAREMTQRILNKKATLPRYLKRRERPWFRKAQALLKQLPAAARLAR
jgi:hypothetical protein